MRPTDCTLTRKPVWHIAYLFERFTNITVYYFAYYKTFAESVVVFRSFWVSIEWTTQRFAQDISWFVMGRWMPVRNYTRFHQLRSVRWMSAYNFSAIFFDIISLVNQIYSQVTQFLKVLPKLKKIPTYSYSLQKCELFGVGIPLCIHGRSDWHMVTTFSVCLVVC